MTYDPEKFSPVGNPHPDFILEYIRLFKEVNPGKELPEIYDRGSGRIRYNGRYVRKVEILTYTENLKRKLPLDISTVPAATVSPVSVSDDVLRALTPTEKASTVGWIFPDGSVVRCDIMRHRDVLPKEYRDRYEELVEHETQVMYAILNDMDPDEHPAMHRFDPEVDANDALMLELDDLGYLRFGLFVYRNAVNLELRSSAETIARHRPVLRYLAAGLGVASTSMYSNSGTRLRIKL